jgi:hypothetical protein
MDPVLRTAVVTAAWVVVQSLVGYLLLRPKGRPYKAWKVVIHVIVFVFIAAGWGYTVSGLSALQGSHVGSWIAEAVMGLAVLWTLVGGVVLVAGRVVPAPKRLVFGHQLGNLVALLGALAAIVCMLAGV